MIAWPADSIEKRPVAALVPYARNARTHSDAQIAQIASSIKEWGWTVPVLADEAGVIIAGHGRVLAAQRLGLVDVPVMVARNWTEAQKRAYTLADNKLTENGGWDAELLKLEVADLAGLGFDLPLMGFSADELMRLSGGNQGLTDPDEAPQVPAEPITKPGDVWLLGPHRLVCGDATSAADVACALAGVAPHLMVTDPPYGVDYDPNWRTHARNGDGSLLSTGKGRAIGKVQNDNKSDWREAWALFPGEVVYCWHAGLHASNTQLAFEASGFELRCQIIWAKQHFVVGRGHYHVQHEPCFYIVRAGKTGHWSGDRTQSTIWHIDKPQKSETGHSTQKPVECMRRPIENNSSPGQAVYDPFVGSGTTIIAAEMTGRACHALEIDPGYCEVAATRWENFTGKKAERLAHADAA
jgi:DNA modification methylase